MQIRLLDKDLHHKYTDFIKSFKGGLFYYSLKYKEFLEELLKCQSEYYIALDGDQILAVMPMTSKNGAYGKIYNSLPFYGSHGGILSHLEKATNVLVEKFNSISNSDQTAVNMLVENPIDRLCVLPKYDLTDKRIGQFTVISCQSGENVKEKLMQDFHSKTRNMIRKAQKNDIDVYIDNSSFDFLQKTHEENMVAVGGKAKPGRFFRLIKSYFKEREDYDIYVAAKNGSPIAAMLVFYFSNTVEYFTPVVKEDYRTIQPLSLLIYQAMIDNSNKGYGFWNWGGTWLNQDGVYRFKSRFGAVDKEYKYYIKVNNTNIYHASKGQLLTEYNGFYTVPFSALSNIK